MSRVRFSGLVSSWLMCSAVGGWFSLGVQTGQAFADSLETNSDSMVDDFLEKPGGYLTTYFDNDLFGGTDENYTNGIRLSWISRDRHFDSEHGIYQSLDRLSRGLRLRKEGDWRYNYGLSLTQLMFTPRDIASSTFLPGQRPYAGWLGTGFSLHAKNERELHTLELSLGLMGPGSLAENAQDFIHDLRDIGKAHGWEHQLHHEATLNLHYRKSVRFLETDRSRGGWGIDSFHRRGIDLGTMQINGNVGFFLRLGYNLPAYFSDPKLSSVAYNQEMFVTGGEERSRFGFYTTFAAEGRAVAHDIFLDGNVFRSSASVEKRNFIGELTGALSVRWGRVQLSYAHTLRSEEFVGQDGAHFFGSAALGLEF